MTDGLFFLDAGTIRLLFTPLGAMNRAPASSQELGAAALDMALTFWLLRLWVDEVRGEVKDAFENIRGHIVVRMSFAYARSQDEAELAGAGFFVGMH